MYLNAPVSLSYIADFCSTNSFLCIQTQWHLHIIVCDYFSIQLAFPNINDHEYVTKSNNILHVYNTFLFDSESAPRLQMPTQIWETH